MNAAPNFAYFPEHLYLGAAHHDASQRFLGLGTSSEGSRYPLEELAVASTVIAAELQAFRN